MAANSNLALIFRDISIYSMTSGSSFSFSPSFFFAVFSTGVRVKSRKGCWTGGMSPISRRTGGICWYCGRIFVIARGGRDFSWEGREEEDLAESL